MVIWERAAVKATPKYSEEFKTTSCWSHFVQLGLGLTIGNIHLVKQVVHHRGAWNPSIRHVAALRAVFSFQLRLKHPFHAD